MPQWLYLTKTAINLALVTDVTLDYQSTNLPAGSYVSVFFAASGEETQVHSVFGGEDAEIIRDYFSRTKDVQGNVLIRESAEENGPCGHPGSGASGH